MSEHNEPEANSEKVKKVIVAIHGIGDQTEFATIQKTAAQFCSYHKQSKVGLSLGAFHNGKAALPLPELNSDSASCEFFFAEVYWADIPRAMVKEGYKLEDAQAWAQTIVRRVRRRAEDQGKPYSEHEYSQLEQALREISEALSVMGRVLYLGGRMKLFDFNIDRIIMDYVNDVQVIAEFKEQRDKVIRRFSEKLNAIHQEMIQTDAKLEIYLVAHSEGSVIGLLGLLSAICGKDPTHGKTRPPWLDCVRGFMTIGSPIDKHLELWPELFNDLKTPLHPQKGNPIEWHNYYDLGDPVGFELRLAREAFDRERNPRHWFKFPEAHDHGFTRSLFPGKAHNDYWNDPEVFGHFIRKVVYKCEEFKAPGNRPMHRLSAWVLPYIAAFALLFLAVYTIYKAVKNCLVEDDRHGIEAARQIFFNVSGGASLLGGLTVVTRIPRLTGDWLWRSFGVVVFALGVFGYMNLIGDADRARLGLLFTFTQSNPDWVLIGLVSFIAALVNIMARRYPALGVKLLLWFGGAGAFAVIAGHPDVEINSGEIWPVVIAGAFFLYLWWLTILFFDLVFIWHRYIHASVAQRQLYKR